MQPNRAQSPSARHLQRRPPSPPPDPPAQPHPHTSLPPIRQLHPYLPPPGLSPYAAAPPPPDYPYHSPYASHLPPHDSASTQGPTTTTAPHRDADIYGAVDSEGDDYDQHGPPKKKRRRQALSCTECKRRKIKCDRSQPCAPCTRRGDQAKCQWHIVEPIEKYVTRAEYDELKARFDQLSALVHRLLPAGPPGSAPPLAYYHMGPQDVSGAPPEAVQPYPSTSGAATAAAATAPPPPPPAAYHPMMPPPQNYPGVDAQGRYIKPDESRPLSRHAAGASTSPLLSSRHQQQQRAEDRSPTLAGASPAAAPKKSPLSLAAITSPFTPADQSKNFHAQTLMLGERLRPVIFLAREDPAQLPTTAMTSHSRLTRPLFPFQGRRRRAPRTCMSTTQCTGRRDVSATLLHPAVRV